MGTLEIVLLLAGAIILVAGFLLPAPKETVPEETKKLMKEEIHAMVSQEMDAIKTNVDDVVEEAVTYAVEKTERSLERLSNEKIMAVSEYSDTVLNEIHKNHEEVMFLYDMLNNKHVSLKNTVSEMNRTVKEAAEAKKEAEDIVNSFQKLNPEYSAQQAEQPQTDEVKGTLPPKQTVPQEEDQAAAAKEDAKEEQSQENVLNSNEKILQLYQMGKTEVAIAQELGIGVGEVKLVVGLFRKA